jgi:hypothetical protein
VIPNILIDNLLLALIVVILFRINIITVHYSP